MAINNNDWLQPITLPTLWYFHNFKISDEGIHNLSRRCSVDRTQWRPDMGPPPLPSRLKSNFQKYFVRHGNMISFCVTVVSSSLTVNFIFCWIWICGILYLQNYVMCFGYVAYFIICYFIYCCVLATAHSPLKMFQRVFVNFCKGPI